MDRRKHNQQHKAEARRILEDYAVSRCKTILIGCLEEFENGFGHIWGHGQPFPSLTEKQQEMRELWAEVRLEILGKGQFRIDQLKDRMNSYEINNRTNYTFRLPQDEG